MNILSNRNNPNTLKLILAAELGQKDIQVDFQCDAKRISLNRLPILKINFPEEELFSISAAVQLLAPITEKNAIISNRWLEWEATKLQPSIVAFGGSGKLLDSEQAKLLRLLKELDGALKKKEYLIQDQNRCTVVDTSIWAMIWSTIVATKIGELIAKEFLEINRWLKNIENLSITQKALQKIELERGIKAIIAIQESSWFPKLHTIEISSGTKLPKTEQNKDNEVDEVTKEELTFVQNNWFNTTYFTVKETTYPVLPKKGERNILITSALPYVNNVPHLGNIIGCVLSADIFARYCRQRNYNTLYISGTDEYGTATEAKAIEEKTTPQEICDKYFNIHNDIYRWFGIGFDYFGRTSTPEQTEIVQATFLRVKERNFILTESVDQLLCQSCNRFLADRFVEGTCPRCKYEDARGDQCDNCSHLVNATELINPRCKTCNSKPIIKPSTQFFLNLPILQDNLKEWFAKVEDGWSPAARAVTKPWLRDGLKPRCITRDLKWGIPVPLDGFQDKVFYVWFDAPQGYISITKKYTKEYEKWWQPKELEVTLYQFMAKDNVPFHAIMFPATLMAADQGHVLVNHIMATEYLNYEDSKFSKSRGIGVFGTDARETGIPADVWRFYLAYVRPENQDSNFNWEDLGSKNDNELLNNLGNFVNRGLMFSERNFNSQIPEMHLDVEDFTVIALIQRELKEYLLAMENAKLKDGVRQILAISKHGNQYMQSQEPWFKIKGDENDRKRAATVIGVCCNIVGLLSALLSPFMPHTARIIRQQLGLAQNSYGYIPDNFSLILSPGHKIGKPSPLFSKIDYEKIKFLRNKYSGKQDLPSSNPPIDAEDLEAAIAKQGQLVRELKAKSDKSVWQPQVQKLLELKNKLTKLQELKNKDKPVLENGTTSNDVSVLEEAIAKQANHVRDLKSKSEKSVWQPQVDKLLELKKNLSKLTGVSEKEKSKKKK